MKKIFSILTAGLLGLMAVSCVQEPLATFDPTSATAPVLGTTEVGAKAVEVGYTPAVFTLGFNEKIAPSHALAIVSVDGKAVSKVVSSKDDGSTLSATLVNISKALAFFGYADGDVVSSLELAVRATLQNLSQDNGVNGFIDSENRLTLNDFTVTIPVGSPYQDYTESCTWSVIGALSEYSINWDGDLEMFATADGDKFVAKAVTLKKDDQFKFRKDQGWETNYGAPGDVEPYVLSVDTEVTGAAGGKNLAVPADGIYDLWLDLSGSEAKITVTDAYLAYPDHKDASTWSVIGALSAYEINWNGDLAMTTDGTTHVAQGIKLSKDDQFKFRKDAGWETNFGATGDVEPFVVELTGMSETRAAGGKNLAVPEDGIFDLILNPDGQTFTIVESLGGKSPLVGGDTPEPGKPAVWSLIGTIGGTSWDTDTDMTNTTGDIWVARLVTLTANDEFKIRADHDWAENYGGPEANDHSTIDPSNPYDVYKPELGVAFAAGDKNIHVGVAGTYDVTFDYANKTIKIDSHVAAYSLIGEINGDSWTKDVVMNEKDGVWTSPVVEITGGFKIRFDFSWDDANTYGVADGFTPTVGEPFTAVQPGKDITVPEAGQYKVQFTPETKEVVITAVAYPEHLYMIGEEFGGWQWASDGVVEMTPVLHNPDWGANAEGQFWTVRYFSAGKGFKFNSKREWGGDFWGLTTNDGFEEVGGNCTVAEDGFYLVHIDLKNEKVHVEPARVYGIGDASAAGPRPWRARSSRRTARP